MNSIFFKLVTPEKTLLNKEILSIACNTELGQITVLPNHIPLVANLVPGELIVTNKTGEGEYVYVAGGFIQINPNSEVTVLADAAEHHYEIDIKRAEEAKNRAQKAMSETQRSSEEYAKVAASLERSLGRLKIARKRAHKGKVPVTGEGIFTE